MKFQLIINCENYVFSLDSKERQNCLRNGSVIVQSTNHWLLTTEVGVQFRVTWSEI
jgi:hypothetical protein